MSTTEFIVLRHGETAWNAEGRIQGHTGAQCERRWPKHYARFRSRDPDHEIPAGESARQLYERVKDLFTTLAREHMGERLVLVTHGGVLDALYRFVLGIALEQPREFPIYNASLNVVHLDDARWSIERWGDISHLTRDAALDDF